MLVDICQSYIETINKGDVPNIQNAWQYVSNTQNLKILNQCVNMINFEEKGIGLSDAQCEEIKAVTLEVYKLKEEFLGVKQMMDDNLHNNSNSMHEQFDCIQKEI